MDGAESRAVIESYLGAVQEVATRPDAADALARLHAARDRFREVDAVHFPPCPVCRGAVDQVASVDGDQDAVGWRLEPCRHEVAEPDAGRWLGPPGRSVML